MCASPPAGMNANFCTATTSAACRSAASSSSLADAIKSIANFSTCRARGASRRWACPAERHGSLRGSGARWRPPCAQTRFLRQECLNYSRGFCPLGPDCALQHIRRFACPVCGSPLPPGPNAAVLCPVGPASAALLTHCPVRRAPPPACLVAASASWKASALTARAARLGIQRCLRCVRGMGPARCGMSGWLCRDAVPRRCASVWTVRASGAQPQCPRCGTGGRSVPRVRRAAPRSGHLAASPHPRGPPRRRGRASRVAPHPDRQLDRWTADRGGARPSGGGNRTPSHGTRPSGRGAGPMGPWALRSHDGTVGHTRRGGARTYWRPLHCTTRTCSPCMFDEDPPPCVQCNDQNVLEDATKYWAACGHVLCVAAGARATAGAP